MMSRPVWRPSIELLSTRGNENQLPTSAMSSEVLTRTSLKFKPTNEVEELNRNIKEASQAHNSIARPFVKQTSLVSPKLHQEPVSFRHSRELLQSSDQSESSRSHSLGRQTETKMNSQLVHQQYNSPANMYSLGNIREAIEAQSEQLAPGLRGINFMKNESPVNKQSEVLKLIREQEEEEEAHKQNQPSPEHAPNNSSSSFSMGQNQIGATHKEERQTTLHGSYSRNQMTESRSLAQIIHAAPRCPKTGPGATMTTTGEPKCCECGQPIVGPFAKIQERFVHPHCFNCSTCGNSLKNVGYFTINDKLYCDIHARQVANVMKLNYNFEPNKQTIDNTRQQYGTNRSSQHQVMGRQQQVVVKHQQSATHDEQQLHHPQQQQQSQQQQHQPQQQSTCSNCCQKSYQSATISTMFNGSRTPGCTCGRQNAEIRWLWRPCHQAHKVRDPNAQDSSSVATMSHAESVRQHEQEVLLRNKYESRLISTATNVSGRTPVCNNCSTHIHGPYILAGQTVWCKPCSQRHFVCSSCQRSLLNVGFIEDSKTRNKYHCESCFEIYLAPVCAKCHIRIKDQDCLKALGKTWHPTCFVCAHCKCQFGNSSFYLEDNLPYCERDWNLLFTTKCFTCTNPIEAGDKWVEAIGRNYHSDCFRCTACQVKLEGATFFCKGDKPYCRMHAR